MNAIIEVNESNFEQEVLRSVQPVVVDFWAEWCGPCKMLAPALNEIAQEHAGHIKVAKINLDANQGLAARYDIRSIPTLLFFVEGRVEDQMVGVQGKQNIIRRLQTLRKAA